MQQVRPGSPWRSRVCRNQLDHRSEQQNRLADVPADLVRAARQALSSGEVPDDAEVRSAAITVASRDLAETTRQRRHMAPVVCVMVIAAIVAAASGAWLTVLLFAAGGASSVYHYVIAPHRLRHRLEQFRAAA